MTNKEQETIKRYNKKEIKDILISNDKLVYVDTGLEEFVAKYEDLPDVIVDINDKSGNTDLAVMDFDNPNTILLTTFGPFLNRCDPNVRADIIDRLIDLQQNEVKVKDYKVMDEDIVENVYKKLIKIDMER